MLKKMKLGICMGAVLSLGLTSCCFASTGVIDTKTLNVRSEPIQTSQKVGTVKLGQKYEILQKDNNWGEITFNNKTGWICLDYVKMEEEQVKETETKQEEQTKNIVKYVNVSTLNVRTQNTVDSKKIGTLKYNTKVQVLETINDWDKICADNITGWVCNTYLIEVNNEEDNANQQLESAVLKTAVVKSSSLNVRKESNTDSENLGSLKKNAVVAIVGEENGWYKIRYNNEYGYIWSEYTQNKDITISRGAHTRGEKTLTIAEKATTLALQYVGCKYVWGGTSPNGFDCSGLVYYVYKDYVPGLGRSARPQAKTGTTIDKKDLIMGDLVFFGEDGGSDVTHVGIYIGDGIFVHAANSRRGVVTDTLLSGYYDKNFLHAKRIV